MEEQVRGPKALLNTGAHEAHENDHNKSSGDSSSCMSNNSDKILFIQGEREYTKERGKCILIQTVRHIGVNQKLHKCMPYKNAIKDGEKQSNLFNQSVYRAKSKGGENEKTKHESGGRQYRW